MNALQYNIKQVDTYQYNFHHSKDISTTLDISEESQSII